MHSLDKFQRETVQALGNTTALCPVAVREQVLRQSRRFNIYRNNRAVSLVENLQATYPVVVKLVGDEFFNATARAFIDSHPPEGPVMAEYGAGFATYLQGIPAVQPIAYVADIARLEWACHTAYYAPDSHQLQLSDMANILPDELVATTLKLHPAVQIVHSKWPIGSIRNATINSAVDGSSINMKLSEYVLVTRPEYDVYVHVLSPTSAQFLIALQAGSTIEEAALAQLDEEPAFDTGATLNQLLHLGAFRGICSSESRD